MHESVSNLVSETDFMIELMSFYNLNEKNGNQTDMGIATQGLRAEKYNIYMEQAASYAEEMKSIQEEMNKDPNNTKLIERYNSLVSAQQESIKNAQAEKKAIQDLVSETYNKMLDALQEIIDKRKEALDVKSDLYDYEKTIKEKTKSIASYRKQLLAYQGDDSEEARTTVQKLQLSLQEAEEDLQETEYERWKSDQQKMLDNLSEQTQEWINNRLDGIDRLVAETVQATNNSADKISETLNSVASSYGYTISNSLSSIWDNQNVSDSETRKVVGLYGDVVFGMQQAIDGDVNRFIGLFNDSLVSADGMINTSVKTGFTNTQNVLADIKNNNISMVEAIKSFATANAQNIASLQNAIISNQSSPITNGNIDNVNTYNSPSAPVPENYVSDEEKAKIRQQREELQEQIRECDAKIQKLSAQKVSYNNEIVQHEKIMNSYPSNSPKYMNAQLRLIELKKELPSIESQLSTYKKTRDELQNKLNKLPQYKVGSKNIKHNGLAWTQEEGTELIFRASDGAMLTPLGSGDKVFTKEMTDKLWDIASKPNLSAIKLPNLSNITKSSSDNVLLQIDGINMYGVNDPVEFENQLSQHLQNSTKIKKIIQDNTIGVALGKNSLSSYRR